MSQRQLEPATQFVAALERIATLIRSLQWEAAYAEGLTPSQAQVLLRCAARPRQQLTPGVLAAEVGVTAASMSDTLAALERKGFIRRQPHSEDGRGVVVTLTAEGKRMAKRLQQWDAPLRSVVEKYLAEWNVAHEALLHLLRDLYQQGLITMPRMCFTCRWLHQLEHGYYCNLLQMPLTPHQLRVECPDHLSVES